MNSSIALRAVLAVVLMIGFYLLAIGIAAGLLYIPYAEWVYAGRLHIKIALVCVLAALAILSALLPRFDRFDPPGPRLKPEDHPDLFNELEGVAKAMNQSMPAEVYLAPDVNAWVAQRGGLMGFGSRRVMGLGLPLMRILTRSQFRAVLAHEFGHYHSGDTKLGPWIYKTRGMIGRTLESLGEGSVVQWPFLWYGKLFLRITHAVSRRQEFVADELAARAIGSQALIGGLRTVHGAGPAFGAYWMQECAPVLEAGYRPPLAQGFQRFVESGDIAKAINKNLEEEIRTGKADPYDTHPPLRQRIAAVEHLPPGDHGNTDAPAITLLKDLPATEQRLVESLTKSIHAYKLKPIEWENVCTEVYLPQWKTLIAANHEALEGLTPEALPQVAADLDTFSRRVRGAGGERPSPGEGKGLAEAVVGAALSVLLAGRGAKVIGLPGEAVAVKIWDRTIEPFSTLRSLAEGKLGESEWRRLCIELGINGTSLGQPAKTD